MEKNFKVLRLSINQCDLYIEGSVGDIMDTLYSDTVHLVKKFYIGDRTSLFCHCVSLSRGTWQQNTSFQIEPKVLNIKTSFTRAKLSNDCY